MGDEHLTAGSQGVGFAACHHGSPTKAISEFRDIFQRDFKRDLPEEDVRVGCIIY
jgi:hypothetical protein